MTRNGLSGVGLLLVAIGIAWAIVAVGQGHASDWIVAAIGPARAQGDAALVETLFTLLIFVPLMAVALVGAMIERRNAVAAGARPARWLGIGVVVGVGGLSVAVLYARIAGTLGPGAGGSASAGLLFWGLGVVALQTVAEEIYFRGWLQPALVARWGAAAGVAAGALAFAALHVAGGARAPLSLVNLFGGGLMFGLFALRGGGIAGAVGVHLAWNAAEQLGYGLDPNPGLGSFGALIDLDLAGRSWWGGSPEGLNGSIGMAVVLAAILVPLFASPSRSVGVPRPAMTQAPRG